MINPISNVTQPQPVAPSTEQSTQKPAQGASKPAASSDVVNLSNAAQTLAAILKEASETPAQTAKEAQGGDLQARRLLAKEAAAKPAAK
jgi:hypothetical protein